ncbi:Protein CBG00107 [Caenorhabditis briggsae]|uniref:Protein CBG00107 n=1 Tax=Caenorhabditis briggsae TaxID=6238 RepID=A8WMA9_CAEBR|nr:Protein CBG00107 [Caenorhabditis briggsae]CAP21613.1 Protein CBG00107 [Caenorhabditis briggsae]
MIILVIFSVCISLCTNVQAGSISTPTTTSLVHNTFGADLTRIAESCFSGANHEQLTRYTVRRSIARTLGSVLNPEFLLTIGLTELRSTLNLEPLPPWKPYNNTDPSDLDLASAPTIQAYYDLKEPRDVMRSLDDDYNYEHNLTPAKAYLDKQFPATRKVFKRRFEKIRRSIELLDRKRIDKMNGKYYKANSLITETVEQTTSRRNLFRCWNATN